MLRGDADALARGTVFWQAANEALDVDLLTAADDGPATISPNPSAAILNMSFLPYPCHRGANWVAVRDFPFQGADLAREPADMADHLGRLLGNQDPL